MIMVAMIYGYNTENKIIDPLKAVKFQLFVDVGDIFYNYSDIDKKNLLLNDPCIRRFVGDCLIDSILINNKKIDCIEVKYYNKYQFPWNFNLPSSERDRRFLSKKSLRKRRYKAFLKKIKKENPMFWEQQLKDELEIMGITDVNKWIEDGYAEKPKKHRDYFVHNWKRYRKD